MAIALVAAIAGLAAAQVPLGPGPVVDAVARLKPGEFLWAPGIAPAGPLLLIVNRATQRLVVYRNGVPIAVSTVSTGRDGHRTPTGIFTILQKEAEHHSSLYDDAPMPYMQRLTWRGVALHAGALPGYPASHGCIRLPHDFARLLFGVTRLGATVIVTDRAAVPRIAPDVDLIDGDASPDDDASPDGEAVEWHPERAPSGPVSIVVSARDRRVAVLRDGRIIGSAPVALRTAVDATTAYILRSIDAAGHHWFAVPLSGHEDAGRPVEGLGRAFAVDPAFRRDVAAVVGPGTTIVVTPDSLRPPSAPAALLESAP